jgi:L-cystine transport system permease protein
MDITGKANLIVSLNMGAHSREFYLGLAIMY